MDPKQSKNPIPNETTREYFTALAPELRDVMLLAIRLATNDDGKGVGFGYTGSFEKIDKFFHYHGVNTIAKEMYAQGIKSLNYSNLKGLLLGAFNAAIATLKRVPSTTLEVMEVINAAYGLGIKSLVEAHLRALSFPSHMIEDIVYTVKYAMSLRDDYLNTLVGKSHLEPEDHRRLQEHVTREVSKHVYEKIAERKRALAKEDDGNANAKDTGSPMMRR